jgi:periplasmic protein TonB
LIVIPPDPSPTVFIAFEKPPEPVFKAFPEYPDVAKRTGLEGTVIVQVLLNKEGKVKRALVAKTNNEIFSEAAVEAAQKWVFTPALMQGKPVIVWISIPFRFRLTGK